MDEMINRNDRERFLKGHKMTCAGTIWDLAIPIAEIVLPFIELFICRTDT